MGKKKKNGGKRGASRFFRWIRSDLPDDEDQKSPVLLLGVNKITDSPSFTRRRSTDGSNGSGSIRFFRPPKSKYTRGLHGDERLEKIRQDLLTHKTNKYIPNTDDDVAVQSFVEREGNCLKLNCAGNCNCDNKGSSNRGSFLFHRPENRQSSLCPSEPYGVPEKVRVDCSENDIEFKYTEHKPDVQHPCSSKQSSSYNVTPKSTERRHFALASLNERFKKTLSLDSRKVDRLPLSLPQENRPKSLVNTSNVIQVYKPEEFQDKTKERKKRFRPKSFFSLETFFDKKSDSSSVDDHRSSKYKKFELESDDSPLFRREASIGNSRGSRREKTPDLLNLPIIIDSVRKKRSDPKKQLEKLECHYYRSLGRTVIDAIPKDATIPKFDDDNVEYIEPIRSNFTSESTLILDPKLVQDSLKPESILTINTDDTDIKLPSSTVSPKSNDDFDIGEFEIEVKEADLLKNCRKELIVKVMDKSVDSIGSCSLDVDASTDFSDTTSGSLNLLTPSSTTSRIKDFTSRIQDRAASANVHQNKLLLAQASHNPSPAKTPELKPKDVPKNGNLLKPPPKVVINETASHRSRTQKKRDDTTHKKPSYLNLACSVNGYTNLTTYDSKLRQDINRSREASPIRPITHYNYRTEYNNSLLVPVPVSANKLLVPNFGPHDTRSDLTAKAPTKAHTDPHLATSPLNVFMAAENKQLKNDFLGPAMTSRSYISSESKTFASSMLHQKDEVDNAKEVFKSSYSETNFMSRGVNGQDLEARFSSESFTIHNSNGLSKRVEITKENGEKLTSPMKSFIQQRVERLYGPGALAQGFFNQKRHKISNCEDDYEDAKVLTEKSLNCQDKFNKSFSPKRSSVFESENCITTSDPNLSLPVLRHLRPEFRAQLPILSPKKSCKLDIASPEKDIPVVKKTDDVEAVEDVKSRVSVISLNDSEVNGGEVSELVNSDVESEVVKDGHYFLVLEKKETDRLIAMAVSIEEEMETLQNKNISEEVMGFLRSASGKARLLATQKMQQFQGLCYNNINERGDEQFPTTVGDLQGFWDMVCLQVRNVDALFEHIDQLRNNDWKELMSEPKKSGASFSSGPSRSAGRARAPAQKNEKARLAAQKRDADRKAMLEHRRKLVRERQLAERISTGATQEMQADTSVEGAQVIMDVKEAREEVEIFVGRNKLQGINGDGQTENLDS